jgi:sugar phosphate isomerase/epimerase
VIGVAAGTVLLGTVAIEPNRWSTVDSSGAPVADLFERAAAISSAGFDGLELWERHLPDDADRAAVLIGALPPVRILNSYVSFDADDPAAFDAVATRVRRCGANAVKFNVGADPASEPDYVRRTAALLDLMADDVMLLCECHEHISIAEDPIVAARLFDEIGSDRLGAIVHTHEPAEHLRRRFDAYGERISHVHVNYLDMSSLSVPSLSQRVDDLGTKVDLLRSLGFDGSWTLEFVHGVLTERDQPVLLVEQASVDVALLRAVLKR